MTTNLESKAAYVAKKLSNHRVSAVRVLEAMVEWNALPTEIRAEYTIPEDNSWTDEEVRRLRELYASDLSADAIVAAMPGRSYSAITHKAWRECIKRPPEYMSRMARRANRASPKAPK